MAEGPRDALVSRNYATTKYPYRMRDPTFSRFYTILECDRHTHRRTDRYTTTACTALA